MHVKVFVSLLVVLAQASRVELVDCSNGRNETSCSVCPFDREGRRNMTLCGGDCHLDSGNPNICVEAPRGEEAGGICIHPNSAYSPKDDIIGQSRSTEPDVIACQTRCARVTGCSFFSFWADGGCHLSSGAAVLGHGIGVSAGSASCSTAGSGAPTCTTVTGDSCVFPFTYDGQPYTSCTLAGNTTLPWCSLNTDSSGNHMSGPGSWGYCQDSCPANADWTGWGPWSAVGSCSRLCGGGTEKLSSRRACLGDGCSGEVARHREDTCNPQACICDRTGGDAGGFCNTELQYPVDKRMKITFCELSFSEKEEALLCSNVTEAAAAELLRSSVDLPKDCSFDPEDLLKSSCGQLVQDKLEGNCNQDCLKIRQDITSTAEAVDEVYTQKIEEVDLLTWMAKGQKAVAVVAQTTQDFREVQNKRENIREQLTNKIDTNTYLSKEDKGKLKEKMNSAMDFGPEIMTSYRDIIKNTNNEVRVLTNQAAKLDKNKSKMKQGFDKVKRGLNGMKKDKIGTFSKAADALGHVMVAVNKFKQGDAINIIGGVLDISNAITQFLPPPASLITGAMSSIFNIFGGGPPSTEDVIIEGFKKQKKWMSKEFNKIHERLEAGFKDIDKRLDTLTRVFTNNIDELKQLLLVKALKDCVRDALGAWKAQEEKLQYIIDISPDAKLNSHVVQRVLDDMDLFSNTAKNYAIKMFVRDQCKGQWVFEMRKACQVLAFASLMLDWEEVKVIDRTVTIMGRSSFNVLINTRLGVKKRRQDEAKEFLKEIFTSVSEAYFSYVSCGLSNNSLVQLEPEQKQQLITFAEYLEPGLAAQLKEREACKDGVWSKWGKWCLLNDRCHLNTYYLYGREALDVGNDQWLRDCEGGWKEMRKRSCNNPEHGGVPCLDSEATTEERSHSGEAIRDNIEYDDFMDRDYWMCRDN